MPSTRRRFLTGVTALSAALAGCNEGATRAVEETATPVPVPRTDREVLAELADVKAPDVPSPVVVTDAHFAAAVEHVERLRASIEARRDALDEVDDERLRPHRPPEDALQRAADHLADARESGPSTDALSAVERVVGDLARLDGLLRVAADDVDVESLRAALEEERTATARARAGVDYRIARPVADGLPTAVVGERTLNDLDALDDAERMLDDAERGGSDDSGTEVELVSEDGEARRPHPELLATVYQRIERQRRRRDDAERYLETATDPDAPSLGGPIADELDAVDSELAALADRFGGDDDPPRRDESVAGRLRSIRTSVGSRSAELHASLDERRQDGQRLYALSDAVTRLLEFDAIDVAVSETLPLAQEREFPTERLPGEKRRAVDALDRIAGGSPLQRHLGARAHDILRSADRYAAREDVAQRDLVMCHFTLVAAAEWAERAIERGEGLSESLRAQQS